MNPGTWFSTTLTTTGDFVLFTWDAGRATRKMFKRWGLFLRQCESIGVSSLGIVSVAALFMGAVIGYQLYEGFHRFGAEALLGGTIGVSLFRELGPVFAGIMVTGRAGAAMAAEIASMRISEQVDALEVMAVDPIEFLVTPRVWAGTLTLPLLSLWFCVVASFSGAFIACAVMGLQLPIYIQQYIKYVDAIDVMHCLVKGAGFGFVIAIVGCYCGYVARGGARAVGLATRTSVVATCLTILLADYIITSLLPFGDPFLKV